MTPLPPCLSVTRVEADVVAPLFRYSDTWQLVINTGTTVLTFLAVFLIQNSQNRDGAAIQAKLDEILNCMLSKDPFWRYEGMNFVAAELRALRGLLPPA